MALVPMFLCNQSYASHGRDFLLGATILNFNVKHLLLALCFLFCGFYISADEPKPVVQSATFLVVGNHPHRINARSVEHRRKRLFSGIFFLFFLSILIFF